MPITLPHTTHEENHRIRTAVFAVWLLTMALGSASERYLLGLATRLGFLLGQDVDALENR